MQLKNELFCFRNTVRIKELDAEPPEQLDNAKVLLWCHLLREEGNANAGAAICQYMDGEFYLFICDSEWQVIGDTVHDSVDEATDALDQWCPSAYRTLQSRLIQTSVAADARSHHKPFI